MRRSFNIGHIIVLLIVMLGATTVTAAVGDHVWSQGYSASGRSDVDGGGNVAVAGGFFGSVDFGGGNLTATNMFAPDIFLVRFDSNGGHLWSKSFATTGFSIETIDVAVDAVGNIYIAGAINNGTVDFGGGLLSGPNQAYIVKFDPTGAHLWSATYGDGKITALSVSNTTVAFAGRTSASIDFGGGPITSAGGLDVVAGCLTAAGAHVWSAGFGDAQNQIAADCGLDTAGNVVVVTSMEGAVDFGGGALSANGPDLALAKFDGTGVYQWSGIFDGIFTAGGGVGVTMAMALDASNNIVIAGDMHASVDFGGGALTSAGSGDLFVAKFNASGAHQWSDRYGSTSFDGAHAVSCDSDGNIVVSGTTHGDADFGGGAITNAGISDAYVVMYDASGAHVWSAGYGSASSEYVCYNTVGPAGEIILAGGGSAPIDFGGGLVDPIELFLVKLNGNATATGVTDVRDRRVGELGAYPNPFNPSTTVRYEVAVAGRIQLRVYDVSGALVETLVDNETRAAGVYQESFDVRGASGVYFVRLQSAHAVRTIKVVAIK